MSEDSKEDWKEKLRNSILEDNKMLFAMKDKSCTETCMCWGLEVSDAWLQPIDTLCRRLEGMNALVYPLHRVRIQADQVKSKYATLRFYYTVVVDPPKILHMYEQLADKVLNWIGKIDFKMAKVIVKPAFKETVKDELTEDAYKDALANPFKASNEKLYIDKDGKRIREIEIEHYDDVKYVPTKHRILYAIYTRRYWIKSFFTRLFNWEPSYSQQCIGEWMDDFAAKSIAKTEKECEDLCEHCGKHIGSKYSPRCTTRGWIAYLCKDCADKHGGQYVKNGEVWQAGKLVMTREQYAEEQKKWMQNSGDEEDEDES